MNRTLGHSVVIALTVLLPGFVAAQTANSAQSPDLATVVQRVEKAQIEGRDSVRPYIVTRDYRFFSGEEKQQPDSEVTAEVSYYPPDTKEFAIRNAQGNGRGERVVRKVLEHETQMASAWRESVISDENYKFSLLGEETLNGRRCYVLGLEPKRDSKELLKGKAWVDAEDYRIHKVVGEPAKSPSWWIKKLQVTLAFGSVQGMWLQTMSHAEADVRMFGHHVLSARDVSYQTGNVTAATKRTVRRPQRDVGTGILIVR